MLATYNGAQYLPEQLDSILAQSDSHWHLLIRDDGSTDLTADILDRYSTDDPRIEVVKDSLGRLGSLGNFSELASLASARRAPLVMFADQDDVWFPYKIECTLNQMRIAESRWGSEQPLMIHTDLEVVSRHGERIHPSFLRFQRLKHHPTDSLRMLLVQNFVTGCTTMVNHALLSVAVPLPVNALVHDWWLALCAASMGAIDFVPQTTVAFRRHEKNVTAVRGFWRTLNPVRTSWRETWQTGIRSYGLAVKQAEALLDRLRERACESESTVSLVMEYVDLHKADVSAWGRVKRAASLRLRSQTLTRTAFLYLRIIGWRGAGRD